MKFKKTFLLFLLLVFVLSTVTANASSIYYRDNIYCSETVAQQAWYTKLIKLDNINRKHVSGTLNFELVPDKNAKGEYFREDNQDDGGQINPEEGGGQINPEEGVGQIDTGEGGRIDTGDEDELPPGSGGDDFQESVKIVPGVTKFSYKVPFSSDDYVDEKFNELALGTKDPAGNSLDLFNHASVHEWGRIDTSDNIIAIRIGKLYEQQFQNKELGFSQNEIKENFEQQKTDSVKDEYKLSWPGDTDTEGVVGWKNSFGSKYYNSEDHLYDFLGAYEFGSQFLNDDEDFRNGTFNVVEKFHLNNNLAVNFYLRMTTRPIAISKTYDDQGNIKSIEKPLIPSKDAYSFIQKHNDSLMKERYEDVDGYVIDKVFRYRLIEKSPDGIDLKPSEKQMIVDVTAYGDQINDIHVFEDEESADKFYKDFFKNLDEGSPMEAASLHCDFIFSKENKVQLVNEINGYTITVDPNGGNWNGDTAKRMQDFAKGDVFTLPEAPERDGYKFLYWKGSEYQPGEKYVVQGDHTFTAEWKKDEKKPEPKKPEPNNPTKKNIDEVKTTPEKPTSVDKTPKTGDSIDMALYAGVLVMMSTGVLLILRKKSYK